MKTKKNLLRLQKIQIASVTSHTIMGGTQSQQTSPKVCSRPPTTAGDTQSSGTDGSTDS
jgi:hypothetical protein